MLARACCYTFLVALNVSASGMTTFAGVPKEKTCGVKGDALEGDHDDGTYEFKWHSWVSTNNGKHASFGRCVQNEDNKLVLFVDWKKTGVSGYAAPSDNIRNVFPSRSLAKKTRDSTLWYGPQPSPVKAKYYADVDADSSSTGEGHPVEYRKATTLESRIRVGIPESVKDLRADTLQVIDVIYQSNVTKLDTGPAIDPGTTQFLYQISWIDKVEAKQEASWPISFALPVSLRTDEIHMIGRRKGQQILFLHSDGKRERRGIAFTSRATPQQRTVQLQFYDATNKEVAATATIAIYLPLLAR